MFVALAIAIGVMAEDEKKDAPALAQAMVEEEDSSPTDETELENDVQESADATYKVLWSS